jgi:diphosphate-dependent phosphofructokinase
MELVFFRGLLRTTNKRPKKVGDEQQQPQQQTNKQTINMSETNNQSSLAEKDLVHVAMMTAGGLAPCLSSSIAQLVHYWVAAYRAGQIKGVEFRFYRGGYKGLLTGDSFVLPESEWDACDALNHVGGSPIGNSRVKVSAGRAACMSSKLLLSFLVFKLGWTFFILTPLTVRRSSPYFHLHSPHFSCSHIPYLIHHYYQLTNVADCIKRGYVEEGHTPLEVASKQLLKDDVHVLHTIGGDDTNTQAATLTAYLMEHYHGKCIVIGMPKTIDNDVYPIVQTFGANTAAEQGAKFFLNVVNESTANPRMLVLHEVMGRDSGYLTAATACEYRKLLAAQDLSASSFPFNSKAARDIHAIWIPELKFDLAAEGARLKKIMDVHGCLNVFFGEGTGVQEIVADLESRGEAVPRDAFGHVTLAKINPGQYFSSHLSQVVGAEKTIVQKSGYFARSAAANAFDQKLIGDCAKIGVESAIAGISGCMGQDENTANHEIRAIEFERVKGGKPFDVTQSWFQEMLQEIGQV